MTSSWDAQIPSCQTFANVSPVQDPIGMLNSLSLLQGAGIFATKYQHSQVPYLLISLYMYISDRLSLNNKVCIRFPNPHTGVGGLNFKIIVHGEEIKNWHLQLPWCYCNLPPFVKGVIKWWLVNYWNTVHSNSTEVLPTAPHIEGIVLKYDPSVFEKIQYNRS